MLIKSRRGWELPENEATPHSIYLNRRSVLKSLGFGVSAAALGSTGTLAGALVSAKGALAAGAPYPADRNTKYAVPEREISDKRDVLTYNNFYEFGTSKNIHEAAQQMQIDPWKLEVDGEVDNPLTLDMDAIEKIGLEERIYRHRCVETWSMTVPWTGFPLSKLIAMAQPKSDAKYIRMQTLADEETMPTLRQHWYPWPYTEGLTVDEGKNELAFMATGLYGESIAKQNGAPIRLVVPWKFGFKSIKSVVRITFTNERPVSFWEELQASEYGFWANVNPEIPHPRWSQAEERLLSTGERVPTMLYNGYAEQVADLYKGLEKEYGIRLYR